MASKSGFDGAGEEEVEPFCLLFSLELKGFSFESTREPYSTGSGWVMKEPSEAECKERFLEWLRRRRVLLFLGWEWVWVRLRHLQTEQVLVERAK